MKSRKVIVTLEIETDEKLRRIGRSDFWTRLHTQTLGEIRTGETFDIYQATATVSQPARASAPKRKAKTAS